MRIFITSKNKYLSNDMKIFGTCSIPLTFCGPLTLENPIRNSHFTSILGHYIVTRLYFKVTEYLYVLVVWKQWLLPTEAVQYMYWCYNSKADLGMH